MVNIDRRSHNNKSHSRFQRGARLFQLLINTFLESNAFLRFYSVSRFYQQSHNQKDIQMCHMSYAYRLDPNQEKFALAYHLKFTYLRMNDSFTKKLHAKRPKSLKTF
ncbi:hypothetical protein L596_023950 [Steinernema carpocapsae]|uniref:Uncharacterized protein n=1 Tax=Steinernema carpocapsae TaxID=34508 RepID=A0A4U5MF76_STECR|nr:hypothetical protein L596_023950 [Steinernema carpocapsae]